MGFDEATRIFIESLENFNYRIYTDRPRILDKNKLHSGEVDVDFVIDKIEKCEKKENYFPKDSWDADDHKSHTFIKDGWYIKFILKDGIVNIISVHEDEYHD